MRILLLSPDFPPGKGGIQLLTGKLAEGLASDKLTVLARSSAAAGKGSTPPESARVLRLPQVARFGQYGNVLIYNLVALMLALVTRPDAILVGHVITVPAARLASRLLRRPYVLLLYGQEIPHRPELVRWGARGAHATVAISRHAEDEALKAGAPAERIRVINPGIDLPDREPGSTPRPRRPTIVTIARMVDRYKGHDVMIEAVDQLRITMPELHWVVIGDGPQREKYEKRVVDRALEENVTFLGIVGDSERDDVLASADVFAMPSRVPPGGGGEGFGLVYLEAGGHGVPVVAGDEGGAMDAVVDGVSGLLVDPRDANAVAAALDSILTDRVLATRLSEGARAEAESRSWATFTEPIRALLEPGSELPGATRSARPGGATRRVLAVSHTSIFGGAERSLLTQLTADVVNGQCEVILAAPPGPFSNIAEDRGLAVVEIPGFDRSFAASTLVLPRALLEMVRCGRELAEISRREHIELIHANSLRAALLAIAGRPFGGPPVVAHVRDNVPSSLRGRIVAQLVRRGSTSVVANSQYAAAAFRRASSGGEVSVVYNAVEIAGHPVAVDLQSAILKKFAELNSPVLTVVGQITPWKGQDIAIRTLAAVKPYLPDAKLVIVGSVKFAGDTTYENGRFEADLRELAAALRVEQDVLFTGELADVEPALVASDIVLMPSWEEPFGRAAVEAMACGKPVIATNVGGPAEFIEHGFNGLLASPGVVDEWADAVRALSEDEQLREDLGNRARNTAQSRFTPGAQETSFGNVYSAVPR
ncbi:MAG: glycosyltransferase family 4 protein [Thermoleophilaceae bacterium]|nr:glycosyltransferase family 4 protein [Thermoleophilaceae bacterium]